MSYRFLQERVGSAVNGRALASLLIWVSAGGRFLPVVRLNCGCGRWKRSELNGRICFFFLLPHFHDLCWQKQRRAASLADRVLSGSGTLGMDSVPVFPGPSLELSWITLPLNEMCSLIVQIILREIWRMSHSFFPSPLLHFHIPSLFLHFLHLAKSTKNQSSEAETETFLSDLIMFQTHTLRLHFFRCKGG